MKKILIATNCVFFAIILFQACSTTHWTNGNGSFSLGNNSSCYNCVVDDLHGEPAYEFVNVTARYKTTHQQLFNKFAQGLLNNSAYPNSGVQVPSEFKDARSCWFSLDTLQKYQCLLLRYSKELGIPSSRLGIRFYYCVYPDEYQRDPTLSNRHTLYLVSTYDKNNTGLHIDFDPRATARMRAILGGDSIVTIAGQIRDSASSMFAIGGTSGMAFRAPSPSTPASVSMNQGDLCPPGTGCYPTLDTVDLVRAFMPLSPTTHQ